ncbi:hypothetical protein E3Q06_04189 [Wallemia mellicola]|uniref:Uncharacterized protein n=2 Tax=Wallemia mellicola TaxID=1708541 RepID=A0A4T0MJW5_9BASI|nr:hypothetical protein E3Q24_04304 [Wallemia mellicola]TIB79317.1 hypothetical protein E3Q21_04201 [Wallemia mellicola]TIB83387.1 hypothetical protein E3Q20_04172 [Wallemia mellicola]TIC07206.1 hypothetical protein E3Q15_04271 [Wallemia mellicola]TIC11457.1 hypothetical protein E3Q13_04395 [Wallemia mellicola]
MDSIETTGENQYIQRKLLVLRGVAPLSAFTSLAVSIITAIGISPSLGDINDDFYTHLTPKQQSSMVGFYWIVLYALQAGTCFLFVGSQKDLTQMTLANALGYQYVISHVLHSLWAIFWILRSFTLSSIMMSLQTINLLSMYVWLCRATHLPDKTRPLDYFFIHIPIRMWTVVTVGVELQQSAFIAFDWLSTPTWRFSLHQVPAMISVAVPILLGCAIILVKRDHIWMLSHMWVLLALFLRHPKPFLVNFVAVAGWILLPLSLIGNAAWSRFLERREELHRIRLEEDAEERFEREHIAA